MHCQIARKEKEIIPACIVILRSSYFSSECQSGSVQVRGDAVTSHHYGSSLFDVHFKLSSLAIYFQFLENIKFDSQVVKCAYFRHDCTLLNGVLFALSMVTLLFGIKNFPITLFN